MLSANLHEYLILKGKVSLPGLGLFEYSSMNAFQANDGNWHPPSPQIKFINGENEDGTYSLFRQFAARNRDASETQVEQLIREELNEWTASLNSGKAVIIPGIGMLLKKEGTEAFSFRHNTFSNAIIPGPEPVYADRIIRSNAMQSNAAYSSEYVESGNRGTSKIWKELGFAFFVFILLALVYFAIRGSSCIPQGRIKNPLVELTHIDESRLNKDPAEFTRNLEIIDSGEMQTIQKNDGFKEDSFVQPEIKSPEGVVPFEAHQPDKNSKDIISADRECIIILGSFLRSGNAEELSKALLDKGLKLYTGSYGNYTRIGVYEPCADIMLRLSDYRSSIDTGAWILTESSNR